MVHWDIFYMHPRVELDMGTTYYVANSAKRQYFDPGWVGGWEETTKRSGILWGLSGHALAHLLLPDITLEFYLESWIGDSIFLVGDDSEPNSIVPLKPFQQEADQDAYHIVTEQFDNISLNLIAHLCKHSCVLDYFLDDADQNYYAFVNLAHTIMNLPCPHIEMPFVRRFGTDWRLRYIECLKAEPWRFPLPMTPESKRSRSTGTSLE